MPGKSIQETVRILKNPIAAFYFIVVPFVILAIFLLPQEIRNMHFIFYHNSPAISTAFLSAYTHSGAQHFLMNFVGYLLLMFLIFIFSNKRLPPWKHTVVLFVGVPLFTSFVSMHYLPGKNSQGISGIVSALVGYLTYTYYRFSKRTCCPHLRQGFVWLVFVTGASILLIREWLIQYAVVVVALNLFLLHRHRTGVWELVENINYLVDNNGMSYILHITVLVIITLALPIVIIPSDIVGPTGVTNIFSHYSGYLVGFILPMIRLDDE